MGYFLKWKVKSLFFWASNNWIWKGRPVPFCPQSHLSSMSILANVWFQFLFQYLWLGEGQGWRKMARQWWPLSIIAESGQWTPVTDCCWRPFIIKSIQQRKLLWIVNLDACFLRFLTKWASGLWTIGLLVVIGCWDNGFGLEACHSYQLDYESKLELGKFEKQAKLHSRKLWKEFS